MAKGWDDVRIAIVTQSEVEGGAEVYLRRLYRELSGTEAIVIGNLPGWTGYSENVSLGPKWSRRTLPGGVWGLRGEKRRVLAAVRRIQPDLIHVQFKREQVGFTRALSTIAPVVWTEHGVMPKGMRLVLGASYRRASRYASAIVTVSDAVRTDIAPLVDRRKIRVIENGVDASGADIPSDDEKRAARRSLGVGDGPLAVWVGRLDVGKRPLLAARATELWGGNLLIAGDGPLRAEVERVASREPRVRYLGHVDPTVLYRAADALLLTSDGRSEGLPNVLLEAASFGVPAVATDVAVFREPVSSAGGVLVADDQSASWTRGLHVVTEDFGRRRLARKWAVEHDFPLWAERHLEVFEEALASVNRLGD